MMIENARDIEEDSTSTHRHGHIGCRNFIGPLIGAHPNVHGPSNQFRYCAITLFVNVSGAIHGYEHSRGIEVDHDVIQRFQFG